MAHTEAEITELFEKAHPEIQEMLSSQEMLDIIFGFQKTYQLHIDTVGRIGELTRNLLLGVTSPAEFFGELVLTGTSPDVATKIVEELNQKVFTPVREKISATDAKQPKPVPEPVPGTSSAREQAAEAPLRMSRPESTATSVAYTAQPPVPAYMPPASQPTAPIYTPPAQAPTAPEPYIPPAPAVTMPVARTMAHDVEAMKDGHQPSAWAPPTPAQSPSLAVSVPTSFTQTPAAAPAPQAVPPAPVFTPAPVPMTAPQAPRPAYVPPPINALRSEPAAPKQPSADALPERREITDTLKKYGIDPYHEPVD